MLDPSAKGSAMCRALKQAHRAAVERAFSHVVVVRMADGRLYVDASTDASDEDEKIIVRSEDMQPALQVWSATHECKLLF